MTTIAHAISASYIALAVNGVDHTHTHLVIAALIAASALDFDHLYFILKDIKILKPGKLHKARSLLHELPGFFIIGLIVLLTGTFDQTLAKVVGIAWMVHLLQDFIVGISIPFAPFDKTEISLLPQNRKLKVALDLITILIFGVLWIKYLNAPV